MCPVLPGLLDLLSLPPSPPSFQALTAFLAAQGINVGPDLSDEVVDALTTVLVSGIRGLVWDCGSVCFASARS
jgi:hypothetical protein